MDKPHRWVVVITVAVLDEGTLVQDAVGIIVSLAQPHKVSEVICYDCGAKRLHSSGTPCAAAPRSGYPADLEPA